VLSLLAFVQNHPAYVKVVTDRTGADVTSVPRGAVSGATTVVLGTDDEIERNAPGGMAQARYQRRAVDSWQHNAGEVARQVSQAVRDIDAHLLLVAGDVRAVQLLRDHLPNPVRTAVVLKQLSGGRRPDGSASLQDAAAALAVAELAAAETADVMDRLDNERRAGGLAVEGATATLAALGQGRVDTLIVVDDPADERVAWFGPTNPGAMKRSGPEDRVGRLVDVATRAALLSDAEVRVVTAEQSRGLRHNIGALCRFRYTKP
jgi:peptide subunit release factor 1 (eRF1)